jgi:hypothetical protein
MITFLGGTGTVNVDFFLTCPGGCLFPVPSPGESLTVVAPTQETIGVPFDLSVSVSVHDHDDPQQEVPPPYFDGSGTWTLDVGPSPNLPMYYTTASGSQYAALNGLGMTFVASTPEPGSVGLALVGFLGIFAAAGRFVRSPGSRQGL